ncbi:MULTISPECIES: hypothetical protein [Caldilinea]|uniref:Uncharacterized protein n=1 Tax=Caldilinea aerophila (strain DSM 14535 / JCM 11387 / NBRC 104270 / STL-6-O1) TaxID=926550 RepID=I0I3Q6_CALAS|nr:MULTISPECIES: hypothetical protein [Caldilinea]MBO9393829.1 hypothetical protein [Caldilinea sp.]BAL99893.1 hypothetical protein CLDAP_18540 [Caldilinea aerophila DSM 14535 = NBRC 104270]
MALSTKDGTVLDSADGGCSVALPGVLQTQFVTRLVKQFLQFAGHRITLTLQVMMEYPE